MKIIVCIKQVAHVYVQNGYDPITGKILDEGVVHVINPYDEIALEKALRLKEKAGKGHVAVISSGPRRVQEALRWALAMGADDAIHIVDDRDLSFDPWATTLNLADVIKQMPFDLLLFGEKAIDDELGQVGTFTAELLSLPVVTSATEIEILNTGKALVQRALDRGNKEEFLCPIPAVITAGKNLCRPRYPTFPDRKSAIAKSIKETGPVLDDSCSGYPAMQLIKFAPPKLRPKKILSPDSNLSAAARINFVMTGGMNQKKGPALGGDIVQTVSGIIDFLKEKKFIGS